MINSELHFTPGEAFDWWISGKSVGNLEAARMQQTLNFKD
jgi:hypothetical protein